MRLAHRLLFWLALILAPLAASAQSAGYAGTYRAQAGDSALLVRAIDTRIDLLHLGTNKTGSVAVFATAAGLNGVATTGEVVSLGNVRGDRKSTRLNSSH